MGPSINEALLLFATEAVLIKNQINFIKCRNGPVQSRHIVASKGDAECTAVKLFGVGGTNAKCVK